MTGNGRSRADRRVYPDSISAKCGEGTLSKMNAHVAEFLERLQKPPLVGISHLNSCFE
jgi:hypothetical protein